MRRFTMSEDRRLYAAKSKIYLVLLSLLPMFGCRSTGGSQVMGDTTTTRAAAGASIPFATTFDIRNVTGESYLTFMRTKVKPAIDHLATNGYVIRDTRAMALAFDAVDTHVQDKLNRDLGGLDGLNKIVGRIAGQKVTEITLPQLIQGNNSEVNAYSAASFIGLASGGGVKITYADGNASLNVNYDTTDMMSGRSYGIGPTRKANDASDKEYLTDLENYVRGSPKNLAAFYQTLLLALLNSDTANYAKISPIGQTLLTDFLAVYTAEQARNLMKTPIGPHWDAALLEVTLLAAFHAGQEHIELYYFNPTTNTTTFTDTTLQPVPCQLPSKPEEASLTNYWQFSHNIADPKKCKRSGINVTNNEFHKLEEQITAYMNHNYPQISSQLTRSLGLSSNSTNLYLDFSKVLISDQAPAKYTPAQVQAITGAWLKFLTQVTTSAPEITKAIKK